MGLAARRAFRLGATAALSLACGYAFQLQIPYIVPIFGILLTVKPAPPPSPVALFVILVAVALTLSSGMLLIPWLENYPLAAIMLVGLGIYAGFRISLINGKEILGHFLATGLVLVTAAGSVSSILAIKVIETMVIGIGLAVICQWIVYPFFQEESVASKKVEKQDVTDEPSRWPAIRGTLIVVPTYLMVLTNPGFYLPLALKSIALGQQSSLLNMKTAGRELLGATLLGGCLAVLFWWLLGLAVNLWMFFLWALIFFTYFAAKIYGILASRFSASFWQSVAMTLIILLGSAVMDSENGKDVYEAFATRISLFLAVTAYAWLAVVFLEYKFGQKDRPVDGMESLPC